MWTDKTFLFYFFFKGWNGFLPVHSFYANILLNESFRKHVAHFNIGHTEKWSFTCLNYRFNPMVSLLFAVNLLKSCAKQTHLTFIVHPAAVQRRIEGLMCHCHLYQITWLQIMHNYDKWLMMVLWSPICNMHPYLFNQRYAELRFQTAGCRYDSLGGRQRLICWGENAPMNKYVVWIYRQSAEIY